MEKLINREQLAGMNIHYLFYSLEYFLDAQKPANKSQVFFCRFFKLFN